MKTVITRANNVLRICILIISVFLTGTISAQNTEATGLYLKALDYCNGSNGVPKNDDLAYDLFLKAAKLGHPMAQAKCAVNERLSNEERVSWARKSAEQGCWHGMNLLSGWYETGTMGLPKDDFQSVYWDKRWAETGDVNGIFCYALDLFAGRGMDNKDIDTGISYMEKAANQGYKDAIDILCEIYGTGGLSFDESFKLPINWEKNVFWLKKGAEQGIATCQERLANLYYIGKGVAQNFEEAFNWMKKAADNGDNNAQYNVGSMYEQGIGVQQDKRLAIVWYKNAARNGNETAQQTLINKGESW